jgi:HD-GYP domain-containing protein (c-di-GMP phosphodiesterase class II)
VPGFEHLARLAAAHHERLDGSGYPHGMRDEDLTLPMRLLAVADVYEALTSARPYRHAMSSGDALAVVRSEVPYRLDPEAYSALEQLLGDDVRAADSDVIGRLGRTPQ